MLSRLRVRVLIAVAASAVPQFVYSQAFTVNEIGSCAVARGLATTASPCRDASAIFWNPAATTSLPGWTVSGGLAAIAIKGEFKQDTTGKRWNTDIPVAPVPHFFINYHSPNSKAALGFGFYFPYGLTSQWTEDFPGRFSALKASLKTFYLQPNFAWQLTPTWSIGGGPIFGHSSVELLQSVDLSLQTLPTGAKFGQIGVAAETEFARAKLTGSGNAYGVQLGIVGQPSPNWSVGLRFLSPLEFTYDDGDATFTQRPTNLVTGGDLPGIPAGTPIDALVAPEFAAGALLGAQKGSTKITHPAQLQAGVAYSGYKNWLLEADYSWVGYRRFNVLPLTLTNAALNETFIEDYNNTSGIRVGAEYTIPTDGWKLRAGFVGIASAAPLETVTPLLPEQDRVYWTFGAGIPITKKLTIDATYLRITAPGSRGRIVERTSRSQTAAQLNSGVYNLSANVFSATIRATF